MKRSHWILAALTVGVTLAGVTTSRGEDLPSGQGLVDVRVKGLKAAGGAMQFLSQYDGSDQATAAAAAKAIDDAASGLTVWFPEGSGPGGPGIEKTRAKPEIWADNADFNAKIKAFDDASGVLTNAVAANDPAAIKVALGDVGKSCKACHEVYRGPEE
ncbi:hypothetical protein sos41_29460 [Alphaproteobacteria bacterium SO-S41]|nr:hypothetical protein sos41_29460 [Alphaproteobacteria bacterium SO-S41]